MPNIECVGFVDSGTLVENIKHFLRTFASSQIQKEVVITTIEATIKNLEGENKPFIRVYGSMKEIRWVMEILNKLPGIYDTEAVACFYQQVGTDTRK